jgi:hypothetical protein
MGERSDFVVRVGILPVAMAFLLSSLGGCFDSLNVSTIECQLDEPNTCPNGYTCRYVTDVPRCYLSGDGVAVFDSAQPDVSVDAPYDAGSKEDVNSMDGLLLDMKDALFNMNDALSLDGSSVLIDASSLDGMKDTTIIDAAQGVDGVGSDTRLPDAAGSCSGDLECTSGHCLNGKCVACKTNSHCNIAAGLPFCSAQNTCVSCASSGGASACTGNTSVCEPVSGRCVECADNVSCTTDPNKAFCVQNQCVGCGAPGATSTSVDGGILDGGTTSVCKGATPMCATTGRCVECLQNSECTADPDKAFCVQSQCVGCNVSGAAASAHDGGATGA